MTYVLARFLRAQEGPWSGYEVALSELRAGRKQSHWIWYIFPQLRGLGQSHTAVTFGLDGVGEARAFLAEPTLGPRLARAVEVVHEHLVVRGASLEHLMGSAIDALKLVSSLTLFEAVAREPSPDPTLATLASRCTEALSAASAQGYPRCQFTLSHLAR